MGAASQRLVAHSVLALMQHPSSYELLECGVFPVWAVDAVEHDLLANCLDSWHPTGQGIEHGFVMIIRGVASDPDHAVVRIGQGGSEDVECCVEVVETIALVLILL